MDNSTTSLRDNQQGAVMVEYVITLTVATLAAVFAMWKIGQDMANYYMWVQAWILFPI